MFLAIGAVALGVLLGLLLGGSPRNLADTRLRLWPLAFVGLALQLLPLLLDLPDWVASASLPVSYLVLLAFVVANLRLPGFWLIGVGFLLNALVIGINDGMPVSDSALHTAAGRRYPALLHQLGTERAGKHHLATEDDHLMALADVIPVGPPFHQVLSVGDIVWLAGTAWVVAAAMRRPASATAPGAQEPGASEPAAPEHDAAGPEMPEAEMAEPGAPEAEVPEPEAPEPGAGPPGLLV